MALISGRKPELQSLEDIISESAKFLARHKISISSRLSDANAQIALAMPSAELTGIVLRSRKILEVHLEAERSGLDFDDSARLTQIALDSLGLLAPKDFLSYVRRGDVVEIYNQDHIQVFRSFNFFRLCNYNLDDVLLNKWYVLYDRNPLITQAIIDEIERNLSGPGCITKFSLPAHVMTEKFSHPQGVFLTKFKYVASAFCGPERRDGFITTLRGRKIGLSSPRPKIHLV